jgi:hypothetical protein
MHLYCLYYMPHATPKSLGTQRIYICFQLQRFGDSAIYWSLDLLQASNVLRSDCSGRSNVQHPGLFTAHSQQFAPPPPQTAVKQHIPRHMFSLEVTWEIFCSPCVLVHIVGSRALCDMQWRSAERWAICSDTRQSAVRYTVTLGRPQYISSDVSQLADSQDISDPDKVSGWTVIENLTVPPALTIILGYFIVTLITY